MDAANKALVSRPPGTVIAVSIFWCLTGCLEFLLWLVERQAFDLIFAVFAVVFTVLILKGVQWVFWVNVSLISLSVGVSLLQLQVPSWAPATPPLTLWTRLCVGLCVIALHQFRSLQDWLGIRSSGKRWQAMFWLLVLGLTVFGQFVLPIVKALKVSMRG